MDPRASRRPRGEAVVVIGLDTMIRELIREEIRRLIRPDALAANGNNSEEDLELRERAAGVATRFKKTRSS